MGRNRLGSRRRSGIRGSWVIAGVIIMAGGLGLWSPEHGEGQDRTIAGSAQGAYLYVPQDGEARQHTFDGFTTELSLKVSADVSEHVSAQAKMCFGCHGFEVAKAFVDLRVVDQLNFRVGRFHPAFGEFYLRYDPANHSTIDKPLVYDMGRMLRMRNWNMSILPIPYVDNGVEVNGTHWFNDYLQLDYSAYVVGGLRGSDDGTDLDFIQSRSGALYYIDNNSEPAVGGRVSTTFAGDTTAFTLGTSGMVGRYDPSRDLRYIILGADAYFRAGPLTMRAEYVIRQTEMDLGDDPTDRFAYGPGDDGEFDRYFLKDGFFATTELELNRHAVLIGRVDGMRRIGNVTENDSLRSRTAVMRYTLGMNFFPHRSVRVKAFGQFYDFSDFDDAIALQLGAAASF